VRHSGWRARDPSLVDGVHPKASALRRRLDQHYLPPPTRHDRRRSSRTATVADRNRRQKYVWRAQIVLVLAPADQHLTALVGGPVSSAHGAPVCTVTLHIVVWHSPKLHILQPQLRQQLHFLIIPRIP
jgi:hypothetical protein